MKRLVRYLIFVLVIGLLGLIWLGATQTGLRLLVDAASRFSAGALRVGTVNGALFTSWRLQKAEIVTDAARVTIGELSTAWRPGELLAGRLHLVRVVASDIDVFIKKTKGEAASGPPAGPPSVALPLPLRVDKLLCRHLRLYGEDGSKATEVDRLSFSFSGASHRLRVPEFELAAPDFSSRLQGTIDTTGSWKVDLKGSLQAAGGGNKHKPLAAQFGLHGTLARLAVALTLTRPSVASLTGEISDLFGTLSWQAALVATEFHLADVRGDWPKAPFSLHGSLTGDLQQARLKQLMVSGDAGQAEVTEGIFSWNDGLKGSARLLLTKIQTGKLDAAYPGTVSGELTVSGSFNRGKIAGTAEVHSLSGTLRNYPLKGGGRIKVDDSSVTLEALRLENGRSRLLIDGRAEMAHGLANWRTALVWRAGVSLESFDPALIQADYPGAVDLQLTTDGTIDAGKVSAQMRLASLHGTVRGYPVRGSGAARFADHTLLLDHIRLASGGSTLEIGGTAGDMLDLSVSLASADLGETVKGAAGRLDLHGTVNGSRKLPHLKARLEADGLGYEDYSIARLRGEFAGGLEATAKVAARLHGSDLRHGTRAVDNLDLTLTGSAQKHELVLRLSSGTSRAKLEASGALGTDYTWSGTVHDIAMSSPDYGSWRQAGKAPVILGARQASSKKLCLGAGAQKICLSAQWERENGQWQGRLAWQHLELSPLSALLDLPQPLTGASTATLFAAGDMHRVTAANADIEVADARIGDHEPEWQHLAPGRATLTVRLADRLLLSDFKADFADGSKCYLTMRSPGFGSFDVSPTRIPLQGTADIDLKDLGFVALLTRYTVHPSGSLTGKLALSGSLVRPVARGTLVLKKGKIDLPSWGIGMHDVSFQLTGTGNTIHIQGDAASGPGRLQATGDLTISGDGVKGDFHLVGKDFDTFDLPEYEIRTSPDVRMVFDENGGVLTGRLTVPHAMLTPEEMNNSVDVSDDVVYVGAKEAKPAESWSFATSLQVDLGDDVQLKGYGLKGFLHGSLKVKKAAGEFIVGEGVLTMKKGIFSIYGRTLDIARGKVLFQGGPIDNPGIDLRAQKVVAQKDVNGSSIKVGVDVSGTVDNLQFKLFSDPYMEDSDILAYMVVGRSMSDTGKKDENLLSSVAIALGLEKSASLVNSLSSLLPLADVSLQGTAADENMSLVVGKRLTKELYIGYDHNLFDQKGEVSIRYSLGSGFSLESKTSGDSTGADLLYSFEK